MSPPSPQTVDLSRVHAIRVEKAPADAFTFGMAGISIKATAHRLFVLRMALGKTQTEIAEPAGSSKKSWENWETTNGSRLIDVNVAARLCDRHGVTLDWIYRGIAFGIPDTVLQLLDEAEKEVVAAGPKRRRLKKTAA